MNMFWVMLLFLAIMFFMDYYIYRRFLLALFPSYKKVLLLAPLLLATSQLFYLLVARFNVMSVSSSFYYLFALGIGVTFILFVMALFYDITLSASQKIPFDKSRRESIKLIFDVTMIIAALSYLFEAVRGGFKKPILNKIVIKVNNLNNLKIAQLSDMHVGEILQKEFVQDCVTRINALNVDLVVITGDLIDGDIDKLILYLEPLKNLQSTYGTFYVNGNHEYYHGVTPIMKRVAELNIHVMSDESLVIRPVAKQ